MHAVLGVSDHCIATYPGDFAQALIALDATVEIVGAGQTARAIPFAALHRQPGETPDVETTLRAGRTDRRFSASRRRRGPGVRCILKIRDRKSYEFALASAAVALDLDGDEVREARIALGGVATVPWRARGRGRGFAPQDAGRCRPSAPRRRQPSPRARPRTQRFQDRTRQAHARARAAAGGRIADLRPTSRRREFGED